MSAVTPAALPAAIPTDEPERIITSITGSRYEQLAAVIGECGAQWASIFEQIICEKLTRAAQSETLLVRRPMLLNVSGIPCSGKSCYCRMLLRGEGLADEPSVANAVAVAFDDIMEHPRSPYTVDRAELGDTAAYARWEVPARVAGYELLRRAVAAGHDILLEHSSAIGQHVELFAELRRLGYDVHFRYVHTTPQLALEYLRERSHRNMKQMESYIWQRYDALSALLPEYVEICTTFRQIEQWQLQE